MALDVQQVVGDVVPETSMNAADTKSARADYAEPDPRKLKEMLERMESRTARVRAD